MCSLLLGLFTLKGYARPRSCGQFVDGVGAAGYEGAVTNTGEVKGTENLSP